MILEEFKGDGGEHFSDAVGLFVGYKIVIIFAVELQLKLFLLFGVVSTDTVHW